MKHNHYPKHNVKIKGFYTKQPIRTYYVYRGMKKLYKYCMNRYLTCVVDAKLSFRDYHHCVTKRNGISRSNYSWIFA